MKLCLVHRTANDNLCSNFKRAKNRYFKNCNTLKIVNKIWTQLNSRNSYEQSASLTQNMFVTQNKWQRHQFKRRNHFRFIYYKHMKLVSAHISQYWINLHAYAINVVFSVVQMIKSQGIVTNANRHTVRLHTSSN